MEYELFDLTYNPWPPKEPQQKTRNPYTTNLRESHGMSPNKGVLFDLGEIHQIEKLVSFAISRVTLLWSYLEYLFHGNGHNDKSSRADTSIQHAIASSCTLNKMHTFHVHMKI